MDCWYVLRVIVGTEETVVHKLQQWTGFDAFCPWVVESQLRRTRAVEVRRPLWPSYAFVSWPRGDAGCWHRVVGAEGEGRMMGIWGIIGGASPTVVPADVVDAWVQRANRDGVIIDIAEKLEELRRGFGKGSEVRLIGGAWDGHVGVCQWADDRGVSVRIELFGRDIALYLPSTGGTTKVAPLAQASVTSYDTRSRRKRRKVIAKLARAEM
jgi:transcription antitermination factor NusG